ncbi:MAG: hypothetical protein F4063_01390 [Chloroflexi bacterium]|nr:hypothetical protein [Chloroflexota bacterium]
MRTASGASFDAQFWQAIQRISILHMLLMMFAVIGVVTSGAILAAPNGFGGEEAVLPGLAIGAASIALFVMGLPFVSDIFRIQKRWRESAAVTIVSLGAYLAIFLSLFASLPIALGIGLLASAAVWFMIGGRALADGK